jgi:hypothetical protein
MEAIEMIIYFHPFKAFQFEELKENKPKMYYFSHREDL